MTASSGMALAMRLPASNSRDTSMNPSSQSSFLGEGIVARPCISVCRRRSFRVQAKIREIFMPALSSTMTEGKITSWVKAEGDKVSKGESVVVVESDKADMDVETFYDGILASIVVREGEVAAVGAPIGILAETEEEVAVAKAKYASGAGAAPAAAAPASPPPVASPAPAPVPAPIPAPALATASAPSANASHPASLGGSRIVATPYAKKLAKDLKVDLSTVAGSGPCGRIVAADVEKAVAGPATNGAAPPAVAAPTKPAAVTASAPTPSPVVAPLDGDVVFTGMQAAVARNMMESLAVPVFRVGYTVTTDALDALYKKIKSKGVTMSALLAKAAALALVKHPVLNASCKNGNSFVYNSNINIAVAVAIDNGLITPVLQDADKVDIYSLSRKWKELVDKARAKQLQPAEYSTGTFTISNLGMFGVDRFDAILPPGTGAIMSVGASRPTVVASRDGLFGVKNQMQVNVTADHRIIYGADVAAFLQTLAKIIEDPTELTL